MNKKRKNNITTVMKKEFSRFFGDKRMAFVTIFMPGLLIYFMYTFMGNALTKNFSVDEGYKPVAYTVNCPAAIEAMMEAAQITQETVKDDNQKNDILEQLKDQKTKVGVLIEFPVSFMDEIVVYDNTTATEPAPNVEIYYNSVSTESSTTYQIVTELLNQFESSLSNRFDLNRDGEGYDMASDEDTAGKFFATMFPMLMMIFMYSGCIAIAPESIAGEKERGTMATLLVTPLKRWELAIGKILSLSVIALLSGISSFIGTYLSLPNLAKMTGDSTQNLYQLKDYVMLLGVILTTILVMISLICVISAFAKSVKEAGTLVMPLMMVVMVIGISAMFGTGSKTEGYFYLLPLYNSVQSMAGIFARDYIATNLVITMITNVVVMGLCVTGLSCLFNSEKIIYTK